MTVVVGTAGHIDHGKTTLLRALTGIDPDRLPEERRRGMTIDVGYAHFRLPDGRDLDFVDVPGHDRLVGNMLVGAGEIQAALLVVAADDGPRAQTIEHLELLDALLIRDGIVALTKVDLVDPGRVGEATELIRTLLAGTTLEGVPIVPVSSVDGSGLAQLSTELLHLCDRVLDRTPPAPADDPVRLAIDRTFVIKGRGVVVTGSLRGGRLERGAVLRLVPGERVIRARELQVHGATVEAVVGGGRVALNLAGIDAPDLQRGAVMTSDPRVQAGSVIIAVLRPPPGPIAVRGWPPSPGGATRLHLGTAQVEAAIGRGRADLMLLADGRVMARLRLARPIAVAAGDRFVLRRTGGGRAWGGAVLDPDPPMGPAWRRADPAQVAGLASTDPIEQARALLGLHGVLDPSRLPAGRLDAGAIGAVRLARLLVARPIFAKLETEALAAVAGSTGTGSTGAAGLVPGMSRAELRTKLVRSLGRTGAVDRGSAGAIVDELLNGLVAAGSVARTGDLLHEPGRATALGEGVLAAMDRLERSLATATPPSLSIAVRVANCPPEGLRALESGGRIVRLDNDLAYAQTAYWELARTALRLAGPGPLAPAAFRDATGTSRKYVMAILEDLDRRGILRRTPEGHVVGPRAALADATSQVRVSGIVLAGGASRRFGRDKLVEPIDGVTLLERAVLALAGLVDEVVVVIGPDRAAPHLGSIGRPVRYARDPEPFGGPLVGVRTGLAESRGSIALVVGGDMPWLVPAVLGLLIDRAPAALADPAGILRPLPCALDRAATLIAVDDLLVSGERRLRAVLAHVGSVALPWADWQVLDPGGRSLVDIDERGDIVVD